MMLPALHPHFARADHALRSGLAWLLLAAGCLMATAAAAAPDWPLPDGVKSVEVNGYPLAYIEAGSGDPVVLVHGAWVDHRIFAPQVAALSKTHRAIALSLRHHFPEPWDGRQGTYTAQQHAADVVAFIRALNLGKVHLLGHSRGGGVVFLAALQAPELVRTLILEEPSGLEPLVGDSAFVAQRVGAFSRLAAFVRTRLDEGDRRSAAQAGWGAANGPGAWEAMSPGGQQWIIDNVGTMAVPYGIPPVTCEDTRKLAFPVLVLHGETSPAPYRTMTKALQACKSDIPDPVIVPKAGHNMHVNNPAFFNQAVLGFIERH